MASVEFKFGDRVVHAGRPEWGTGVVTAAQNLTTDGSPSQRLTVRFERAGLKTVSTAIASLRAAPAADAGGEAPPAQTSPEDGAGWLGDLERKSPAQVLGTLPEATADPFASLEQRLRATVALYRFTKEGGSLLDWAAAQTGLADPLTAFSRHELEEHFNRFAVERDQHLRKLLRDAHKQPALVREVAASAPPSGREALRRLSAGR